MAAGGYSSKVETFTSSGWKQLTLNSSINFLGQCMALRDATTAIIIGGYQDFALSNKSFVITNTTRNLVAGPALNDARAFHTCGRILTDKAARIFGVIVVSGYNNVDYLSSVEILDQGATSFVRGKPLPVGLLYNSLVEDPAGGVIIINGSPATSPSGSYF